MISAAAETPAPSRRAERLALLLLLAAAAVLLYLGWRTFWFLTDDAFIAFRYVSNSRLGYGYVWNPPPFRPVEGYTSFLWVVLLDGLWRVLGTPPPQIANTVALVFAFLTLLLGAFMVLRLGWERELRPWRLACMALVLLGVTTNRTFLAWSSSGFETAMFNFLVLSWVAACFHGRPGWTGLLALCTITACLELARPEGLLFTAATLGIVAVRGAGGLRRPRPAHLLAVAPLLAIPVHLGWRLATYGAWLPNTYHAKFVTPWPASGVRYALAFVLEYALWFWLGVVAVASLRRRVPAAAGARWDGARVPSLACVATLVAHFLYYTLVIGGDHFEYRVYSHLVFPIFLSFLWALNRLRLRARTALALLAAFVLLSEPVPWSHWALSRQLGTRRETRRLRVALAPHWPAPLRWYARAFDGLQSWLIGYWVCVRHQEHKVNQEYLASLYPTRAEGEALPAAGFPVHAFQAVGVASWTLPHVNILDLLGLNDWVIARLSAQTDRSRGLAHERVPPQAYVDCFRPNVFLAPGGGGVRIVERDPPLTAAAIQSCESDWAEAVRRARGRAER